MAVGLGLAAVSVFIGAFYAQREREEATAVWKDRLGMTADDRKESVDQWLFERFSDAQIISTMPRAIELLEPEDARKPGSGRSDSRHRFETNLTVFTETHGYRGIYLLREDGEVVGATGAPAGTLFGGLGPLRDAGGPFVRWVSGPDGSSSIAVVCPVRGTEARTGPPTGHVLILADPALQLFPLLRRARGGTESAESLLVRREGDEVVFLSPLRFRGDPPLSLRLATSQPFLAATSAIEGRRAVGEYVDYRGVKVLAATRTIRGSSWALVVKVDEKEAMASAREAVRTAIIGVLGILICLGALGFGVSRAERLRSLGQVARRDAKYRLVTEQANDAIVFFHPSDGRIVESNRAAEALTGYGREELAKMAVTDLVAPDERPRVPGLIAQAMKEGVVAEISMLRKDGTILPIESCAKGCLVDGEELILVTSRDISARKAAVDRILLLNRLLRTNSEIDQLVVRERDEERLLSEACRIVVEHGGLTMAWIGAVDPRTGAHTSVASATAADAHPEEGPKRRDGGLVGGRSNEQAIRERRPILSNDWDSNDGLPSLRDEGRRRNFRATGSFPIPVGDEVRSALSVFARESGLFVPEVVGLLTDLAADIGFGLGAMEKERQRAGAERSLAESEERFRSAFEGAATGMAMLAPDRRVLRANRALREMLGFGPDEPFPVTLSEVTHPDDAEKSSALANSLLSGRASVGSLEKRYLRRDGTVVWAQISSVLLRDEAGDPRNFVVQFQNLTARKRAEAEVAKLSEELEERVRLRTAELAAANRELEAFAYSVSHDLKAPLRAIDSFSQILLDEQGNALDAEGKRILGLVRDGAIRMAKLIDDLLALSRAGRHELRNGPVEMETLFRGALADVLPTQARAGSEVVIHPLPSAVGDASLLRQVATNLLSNAFKFSSKNENRRVEVGSLGGDEGIVYFVKDDGVGFDMKYAGKLFGVFQRLHTPREFEGTGVGLALARRIVERHGGRIWAEGEVGKGATFFFTLGKPPERAGSGQAE